MNPIDHNRPNLAAGGVALAQAVTNLGNNIVRASENVRNTVAMPHALASTVLTVMIVGSFLISAAMASIYIYLGSVPVMPAWGSPFLVAAGAISLFGTILATVKWIALKAVTAKAAQEAHHAVQTTIQTFVREWAQNNQGQTIANNITGAIDQVTDRAKTAVVETARTVATEMARPELGNAVQTAVTGVLQGVQNANVPGRVNQIVQDTVQAAQQMANVDPQLITQMATEITNGLAAGVAGALNGAGAAIAAHDPQEIANAANNLATSAIQGVTHAVQGVATGIANGINQARTVAPTQQQVQASVENAMDGVRAIANNFTTTTTDVVNEVSRRITGSDAIRVEPVRRAPSSVSTATRRTGSSAPQTGSSVSSEASGGSSVPSIESLLDEA